MKGKSKKDKKFNIYLLIVSLVMLIVSMLNIYMILIYDVLSLKYFILVVIIMVLFPLVLIYFMMKKDFKKEKKLFLSGIGILSILLFSAILIYLNNFSHFLDKITIKYEYETINYVVIVLKDSSYKRIEDIKNKKIGYVNLDGTIDNGLDKIKLQVEMQYEEIIDYAHLIDKLYNMEVDAVLIESFYYEMYDEDFDDFETKTQVIYYFSNELKVNEIKKEVIVTEDPLIIYISGIDTYGSILSNTRSDVNIIITINPKTYQILMVNIPRDYYIELASKNSKDKLTHAGMYGVDESIKTIENLLDIDINYYVKVNFAALVNLVDALEGVEVYSKYGFKSAGGKSYIFKKGYNVVNGDQALQFVRTRKVFYGGDRVRGENQQAMITAILNKASYSIVTKYSLLLSSLEGNIITNMHKDDILSIIKMQIDKMPNWHVTTISLNGKDSVNDTYSYPNQETYVMEPDEKTIEIAKLIIAKVKNNDILNSEDFK